MTLQASAAQQAGSFDAVLRQLAAALPAERTLLIDGDRRVTVGEFTALTERLAWLIGAQFNGDARDRPVAMLFPHSADSLIALHAVLRSGAIGVLLAVVQGEAFHQRIIDEVAPQLWVTTTQLLAAVRSIVGARLPVLCIDQLPDDIAAIDLVVPDPQQTVLLYATSGSTGRPRLVERTSAQLLSYLEVYADLLELDEATRFIHLQLYTFAAGAVGSLVVPLSGGTVVFGEAREDSSGELYRLLVSERVTHLYGVLPLIRALSDVAELRGPLPELHKLVSGGEKITAQDWPRLQRLAGPQAEVLFNYGSTEALGTAYQRLSFADADAAQREAALTPLADCTVTIVDEQLRPLPVGAEGEILISSPRISRGYYGMPELSAERFLRDASGRQVYRSGDRGRLLPDGRFTITGRADHMVKIRGYRVELGAVEEALAAQPEVLESAVTTREIAGAQQLVAYLVIRDGYEFSATQLRQSLAQRLPLYAVPLRYCVLPALPRTSTHKINRSALPPAVITRTDATVPYRAPQNELEQRLAIEWAELLGYDRIGIDDDFFALGGDSLSLYRLLTRVEREYQAQISPARLQQVTVAALAARIAEERDRIRPIAAEARKVVTPARSTALLRLLPYRLVHWLIRLFCSMPGVPRLFFPRKRQILRSVMPHLATSPARVADVLVQQMFSTWRRDAFIRPHVRRKYLRVSGHEHLQRPAGQGAVVVGMHTGVGWIVPTLLEQDDPHLVRVSGGGLAAAGNRSAHAKQVYRFRQVLQAGQRLEQGGIVLIAGDGHHGEGLTTRTVLGRRLAVRPGAAELAVQTNSLFVPVFTRLAANGELLVEFLPPLSGGAGTPEERIAHLVDAYADLLAARVNAFPETMETAWLRTLSRYPSV